MNVLCCVGRVEIQIETFFDFNIWNPVIRIAIYLVVRKFNLRGFFCLNLFFCHKFIYFCLFSSNSTYSIQNQVIY